MGGGLSDEGNPNGSLALQGTGWQSAESNLRLMRQSLNDRAAALTLAAPEATVRRSGAENQRFRGTGQSSYAGGHFKTCALLLARQTHKHTHTLSACRQPVKFRCPHTPSIVRPYCPGYYPGHCYGELLCLSRPVV